MYRKARRNASVFLPRYSDLTRTLVYATVAFSLVLSAQDGKMEGSVHRAARPAEGSGGRSMQSLRSMARSAPRYALGRLNASEARPVTRKPGLTPVGVNRSLPQDFISQGEWSTSPEGKRVWRLTLTSADAEAMRVHFQDFHVGDGNVWLLGPDDAATTTGQ